MEIEEAYQKLVKESEKYAKQHWESWEVKKKKGGTE